MNGAGISVADVGMIYRRDAQVTQALAGCSLEVPPAAGRR